MSVDSHKNTPNETIVNECLRYVIGAEGYEETFSRLLSFIGSRFQCARVYIFELSGNSTFSNTYEWCAQGVAPQKDMLQNEPVETISSWMEAFNEEKMVIIEDVEEIRGSDPAVYAALKPQEIDSLVVCPLKSQGDVSGFLGIDNPDPSLIPQVIAFFQVIEYFVVSFMKRRNLSLRLEFLSYHDQLTGAFNRRAYKEREKKLDELGSLGFVYGDIIGLKRVNDRMGHLEGDRLICRCYEILRQIFEEEPIYRMGGDEFLVICPEMEESVFSTKYRRLSAAIAKADNILSVGQMWGCPAKVPAKELVRQAEAEMYLNKQLYYSGADAIVDVTGKRHPIDNALAAQELMNGLCSAETIEEFLCKKPEAVGPLIRSIDKPDSPVCLYIGDVQANVFYLSDNMRDTFGFESNVVHDFVKKWEKRICYEEDLELYRQDVDCVWRGERERHDLKYRIYDKAGKLLWIHCCGDMYRNENGEPHYFVGFITRQEFLIDPVTNFPKEDAALNRLTMIRRKEESTVVVGISLNHFTDINETIGRAAADRLLQDIASSWESRMSHKAYFFRLDGVRFMAVIRPEAVKMFEELIREIKRCVQEYCREYGIQLKYPCSVCAFNFPDDIDVPERLMEKLGALIVAAKNNVKQEYIGYSTKMINLYKSNSEVILQLNADVLNGFRNFRIVIQPVVASGTEEIMGGEVLLRWKFGDRDVPPSVFIPILEKRELICQTGRWVFQEAVRHCRRIIASHPEFHLSFNVSYLQIHDEGFVSFMEQTLVKYGISAENMILELTESHFDDEPEKLMEFVNACRKMGMLIALDDFGSGYSSMAMLFKYPTSIIKLDRSLMEELADSEDRQTFLKTLVMTCHQFDKKVCAEGIETRAAGDIIRAAGGDMIQGYYYYRPLELDNFYEVLNQA